VVGLFALVACSPGDDCQKAVGKLRPFLEIGAQRSGELLPGQRMSDADKDKESEKLVQQCRAKLKQDPMYPTLKCLLDANTYDAVRACQGGNDWWGLPQPSGASSTGSAAR